MKSAEGSLLTINGGSSSIKFSLFAANLSLHLKLTGRIERIGTPDATLSVQEADGGERFTLPIVAEDHQESVTALMDWIEERKEGMNLVAVGHRVVHGGPSYHQPQRLTAELLDEKRYWSAGCVISLPTPEVHCPQCSWEGSKDAMRAYWASEVQP